MYKTILVPLDGSSRAEAILPHVQAMANAFGSKVIFLQVIDPAVAAVPPYGVVTVVDEAEIQNRVNSADSYAGKLISALRNQGIEAVGMAQVGGAVHTILAVATQENADLIAMASHGRTGLARVFYGSVTAGVLHQADRPLLIVRAENG